MLENHWTDESRLSRGLGADADDAAAARALPYSFVTCRIGRGGSDGAGSLPAGGARRHAGPCTGSPVASLHGLRARYTRVERGSRSADPSRATAGFGRSTTHAR